VSTTHRTPVPPREEPEQALSPGQLLRREQQARERNAAHLERVTTLVAEQQELSTGLRQDLVSLQEAGTELEALSAAPSGGMLEALVRRFRRRQEILARRSIAEGLLQRYEVVTVRLRRASAFSDELRLCALELQQEVDGLHQGLARDRASARGAAERVLELEREVERLEEDAGRADSGGARALDGARFDLRGAALSLELFEAAATSGSQQLPPARELRDTVQSLHEEMAQFVLAANATTNAAGRRIQALGMAADAPLVVTELQASLAELGEAMEHTEHYVEEARRLMDHVLPDLSARLQAERETQAVARRLAEPEPVALSRAEARAMAERALREDAMAEVESWLES